MDYLITTLKENEYIYISGKNPKNCNMLFDVELVDPDKLGYLDAYNQMMKLLEGKTALDETINLYVIAIDVLALGAISAFINLVPNITKTIDKATQRTLNVWITDYNCFDSELYGIFEHTYTLDKRSGFYYGRTISRIDREMGLPNDIHIH